MKRGSSPRRHGKRGGCSTLSPSAQPSLPGRYAKTSLSPEFVTWCKRHHYKPEGLARCILHTFALANPGGHVIVRSEGKPPNLDDIYDLPGEGKEPT